MLEDVVHAPAHQLPMGEISSPINAQLFEFYDPADLFSETLQNSEVTSCSNCCYEENSSYATNFAYPQDNIENNFSYEENHNNTNTKPTTSTIPTTTTFNSHEEMDNDVSASIDFSVPPLFITEHDRFNFSSTIQNPHIPFVEGIPQYSTDLVTPIMGGPVFEDDCLSSVPSYVPLNPSSPCCSFYGPTMADYNMPVDTSGLFALRCPEFQHQDQLDYQGDNCGVYCHDSIQRIFNPGDLQGLRNENQQLISGKGSSTSLASEISGLKDSTFKVGKLSVEERREKIHRYMKKRNERNFSKKIKYACRKTLADSRPRVRGRFAKNDEFGETNRVACSHHEDEDEEEVVVKEEDEMVDSSDILAHISGLNSFKCNYPFQSWI